MHAETKLAVIVAPYSVAKAIAIKGRSYERPRMLLTKRRSVCLLFFTCFFAKIKLIVLCKLSGENIGKRSY